MASEVPISHLKISAEQRKSIDAMYHPDSSSFFPTPPIVDHIYSLDPEAQLEASAVMAQHSLDADSREGCQKAEFCRIPPIPIHPSVYAISLVQLRDGATFSDISQKNWDLFKAKAYKDFPTNLDSSPYRWILTHNDSRSLYCQYNRMKGVTVTEAPEINVDDWLDSTSDKFNPTLVHAIFHYSAHVNKGERFEVAIATDKMNHAAWTYGHESQIILDGTFGVCNSRLFLFIVMAIDENQKSSIGLGLCLDRWGILFLDQRHRIRLMKNIISQPAGWCFGWCLDGWRICQSLNFSVGNTC
ncbi:hypothetical protein B0H10DRAFT_1967533 [Mycena sp. CBHHK59/15]|nr:hypothetical protein B0H10DRAFT_1967533 [Mycena sp. CBHHK59/15]